MTTTLFRRAVQILVSMVVCVATSAEEGARITYKLFPDLEMDPVSRQISPATYKGVGSGQIGSKGAEGKKQKLVVRSSSGGPYGLTSGELQIKLHDFDDMTTLLSDYGLLFINEFPNLRRVTAKIDDLTQLERVIADVSEDLRVEDVELVVNFGAKVLQ